MKKIDFTKDYYKGLKGIYLNRILDKVIELGNLKQEKGLILDYGCGTGKLKQKLRKYNANIVGYDVISSLSDVKDFRSLKPSKIVCNAVLELMSKEEIEALLKDFLRMNPHADLIVSFPTKNIISKTAALIANTDYHHGHKINYKEASKIIQKYYTLVKRSYVLTLSQVTKYSPKKQLNLI